MSQVAPFNKPVLVAGQRGIGKKLATARLHRLSSAPTAAFCSRTNLRTRPGSCGKSCRAAAWKNTRHRRVATVDAAHPDAKRVDRVLDGLLDLDESPARLREAMRYVVLGGGKRIRPRLVYATGRLLAASATTLDATAAAVELLHAYSLVHDDLPAMDDDDLRRGRATAHVRYDEATAILVGDALQALAFETLARSDGDARLVRRQVALLARAAGAAGMVGGQMLDMEGESRRFSLAEVERMHRRKSGALIHAAVLMAAAAGCPAAEEVAALDRFGGELGLAFQIHDDVLDATNTTAVLGKSNGADARRGKSTFVSLLGVDAARAAVAQRLHAALGALTMFGDRGDELSALARYLTARSS